MLLYVGVVPVSERAGPPTPPDIVVDAFLPVELARVVVPQPRYPGESSFISYAPTAGMVGSALGLYA